MLIFSFFSVSFLFVFISVDEIHARDRDRNIAGTQIVLASMGACVCHAQLESAGIQWMYGSWIVAGRVYRGLGTSLRPSHHHHWYDADAALRGLLGQYDKKIN